MAQGFPAARTSLKKSPRPQALAEALSANLTSLRPQALAEALSAIPLPLLKTPTDRVSIAFMIITIKLYRQFHPLYVPPVRVRKKVRSEVEPRLDDTFI